LLAFDRDRGNNSSMSDVVQSVRQLLQDFIAPELRELKSDVKQVDSKIDLMTESLEGKIDSRTSKLEAKIDSETSQIRADFKRLEDKMDS
jgi:hypothetical protein